MFVLNPSFQNFPTVASFFTKLQLTDIRVTFSKSCITFCNSVPYHLLEFCAFSPFGVLCLFTFWSSLPFHLLEFCAFSPFGVLCLFTFWSTVPFHLLEFCAFSPLAILCLFTFCSSVRSCFPPTFLLSRFLL